MEANDAMLLLNFDLSQPNNPRTAHLTRSNTTTLTDSSSTPSRGGGGLLRRGVGGQIPWEVSKHNRSPNRLHARAELTKSGTPITMLPNMRSLKY